MKIVIAGGVASGASAATRIRRLDEKAEIIIFEKSGFVSYANCGLPYYIGDIITDEEYLSLQTAHGLKKRFMIDARIHHEVIAVNPQEKTVTVKNLDTDTVFKETYDRLILATGAKPSKPNLPGINLSGIFTLRTVEDALKIKNHLTGTGVSSVSVIGGGFIGIEMAENLCKLGLKVTVIEQSDHLMPQLDREIAAYIHSEMRSKGITIMTGTVVSGFNGRNGKIVTVAQSGEKVVSDAVILAVGVTPDTFLAKHAGLKLGIKDSIIVNEHMQTSEKDIYAVGDAVQINSLITQTDALIPLAGPANKQGRIAADNICGISSIYRGSQGTSVLKLFEHTVATTGINEETAKKLGYNCESVILSPSSHASYYPGGKSMTLKLTFDKDTLNILGAQIVGYEGVDKRIDIIATAMRASMKANELAELENAYAPPFSSAKDPVNMAGFIVDNIVHGLVKQFSFDYCRAIQNDTNVFLLDVRTPDEYSHGYAKCFVNIPLDDLRNRIHEIPMGKRIYIMCQSGLRSYIACRILSQYGYDCYNFSGGYSYYKTVLSEELTENKSCNNINPY